jgi:RimJ/RimL family protein N-acetyltransferase
MAAFPARDWDAFRAHWSKIEGDATVTTKTILFEGQVAGSIVCFEQGGKRQVGYWIGKDYWGLGIATLALSQFLREVPARPLHAYVAKHNVASVRVLQKCGFTVVGEDKAPSLAGGEVVEEFLLKLDADTGAE